ncbi:hypothetical protein [Shewanella sp. AC91-MNA-CIBAN-0169]|jgi:hypothetical protein|uniref:hypothetical protein n=1 Tax=Shewanella sp. AC91-MNA-CIBAN-0169 TaxID=3140466 RepID=UPI00331AF3FB
MRFIRLVLISVFYLLSVKVNAGNIMLDANERCFDGLCTVSIIHLMANADKYERKKVWVTGIADFSDPKKGTIYLDEGSYKHKIYEHSVSVELDTPKMAALLKKEPDFFQGKYVYVDGVYLANLGHHNGDNGGIYDVESIYIIGLKGSER